MSKKSMIVIDTPVTCCECPLRHKDEVMYMGDYTYKQLYRCWLAPENKEPYVNDFMLSKRPKWCPLKPYKED